MASNTVEVRLTPSDGRKEIKEVKEALSEERVRAIVREEIAACEQSKAQGMHDYTTLFRRNA